MKTHFKHAIICVILAVIVLMPVTSFAEEQEVFDDSYYYNYGYENYDYEISAYDIGIVVNEDNSLDVTEKITACFNVPKHGIFRYIPYVNTVKQSDGSIQKIKSRVSGVDVSDNYETYTENNNYVIKIGDADTTITGEKQYTISYTFDMGKDANDGFDALYYNIIGTGWDTRISNVSFTITMPNTDFNTDKLSFYIGEYGSNDSNGIAYTVNENVISGTVDRAINPNEALTVTLFLDEGYFTFNYALHYTALALLVLIPLIALAVVFILWKKYGKDKKIVDVVEFYPPENMNSAEVALWSKGNASQNDVIGLLIELANEGYINIEEVEKRGIKKSFECRISKAKDTYTGDDRLKGMFFDGLFKNGRRNTVMLSDLEESFYKTVNSIQQTLNMETSKVFNNKSLLMRLVGWIAVVVGVAVDFLIFRSVFVGNERFVFFGIGLIISLIAFCFAFFIRQRTDEGHDIKQKINGFKIFLESAEKERLEALVEENPTYFYDILPYAYVLGVSDKWIKNFEGIAVERPSWYYGNDFNTMTMLYFMNRTMTDISRAMVSVPSDNASGGGFGGGGGGFSGGGFGGGGGGSW